MTMRKLLALIFLGFIVAQNCEAMDQNRKKKNKHRGHKQNNNTIDVQENKHRGHKQINNNPIDIQDKDGQTALIRACEAGNLDEVKRCLNQNADPNIQDKHGNDALFVARGKPEIVMLLLDAGANPFNQNRAGSTALQMACAEGLIETVEMLLQSRSPQEIIKLINIRDEYNQTALMRAQMFKRQEIVNLLENFIKNPRGHRQINNNPIDIQDNSGETALIRACKAGNVEEVKRCLNQNADENIKDMHGAGALYYACNSKEDSADTIMKLLLEKGFNPNITETSFERTPLHVACSGGFNERVKLLLHYGANPNIQDAQGNDALFFAGNNPEIVLLLLNTGANPSQNIIGNSALHIACANDHIEVIKMFLQSRSPQEIIKLINVRNKTKISPLMLAKDPSHKEVLNLLENFTKNPPKNPVIVKRRDYIPLENLKISENLKINENDGENNDEEVDECSICLEPFKKTLECGHSFHPRCIDDWLKKNPTCPLCRRPVKG